MDQMEKDRAKDDDRLNSENYYVWEFRMKNFLQRKELWYGVIAPENDSEEEPDSGENEKPRQKELKLKQQRALNYITEFVDDTQISYIKKCTTGSEAWNCLKEVYQHTPVSHKLERKENVRRHINEMERIAEEIAEIDSSKDKKKKKAFLRSLDKEYKQLVTALTASLDASEQQQQQHDMNRNVSNETSGEPAFMESSWNDVVDQFDAMNLKEELLKGIYGYGLEKPSAIQQRAIVPCINGRNVIFQARPGAGKTATFSIAILQTVDSKLRDCQALVLAPTRERAVHIQKVIIGLGDFMSSQAYLCVGGTNVHDDMRNLKQGFHIVVGTLGRVQDMISRKSLRTNDIKLLVVDEADAMLSRDFKGQFQKVFKELPSGVQLIISSPKMTPELVEVSKNCMLDPVRIIDKNGGHPLEGLEGIRHFYVHVKEEKLKLKALCDLYDTLAITQGIIYCNSKHEVDQLAGEMTAKNLIVSALHGMKDQGERDMIMRQFRSGSSRVLITTDLPRGSQLKAFLIINYELPNIREHYLYRISHSGGKGAVISFITNADRRALKALEQQYQTTIEEMPDNVADLI